MGQSQTSNNKLKNQWTFIDKLGRFEIFKNQHGKLAEKHMVRADPKIQEDDYLTAYQQRYLPNQPIVNAYDAQFSQKRKGMCQNASTITVYTEYIPHRLSDIQMLNHGQGVYVLSQTLVGFSLLYNRVGPFQINEDLIGFNQDGQVKVWYNANFGQNSVDNDRIILMSTLNPYDFDRKFSQNQEYDMVEDIINAVARYTKFQPNFLRQVQQFNRLNFSTARSMIATQISRKAYYVPNHLFLTDVNNIIQKSGIEVKYKHIHNPNRPKKGQRYPYFMEQNQVANQQGQYVQGQASYEHQNYYDDYSSQSSDTNLNGGYYNLNGQSYRVIATKQVEGDNINQQALINQTMRNHNPQNQQYQDPNYAQLRDNQQHQTYYDRYNDSNSQLSQKQRGSETRTQQYQDGHIMISDGGLKHYMNDVNNDRIMYQDQNQHMYRNPTKNSQQNVRVFSLGEDGRLIQQSYNNQQAQHNKQYQQYTQQHQYAQQAHRNQQVHHNQQANYNQHAQTSQVQMPQYYQQQSQQQRQPYIHNSTQQHPQRLSQQQSQHLIPHAEQYGHIQRPQLYSQHHSMVQNLYPHSVPINQIERSSVYPHSHIQSVNFQQPQGMSLQSPNNIIHRHKIFQNIPPSPTMFRQQPRIIQQTAF